MVFLPLRAYAPTPFTIGFVLRSLQIHISMQIHFEMCVCALLNTNPVVEGVGAHVFKDKNNFTIMYRLELFNGGTHVAN